MQCIMSCGGAMEEIIVRSGDITLAWRGGDCGGEGRAIVLWAHMDGEGAAGGVLNGRGTACIVIIIVADGILCVVIHVGVLLW